MTAPQLLATIVGAIAAIVFIASYQMRARKWILLLGAVSRILFVLQYVLLGAFAGAVLDVIGALAALIAGRREHPAVKKLLIPIIVITHLSLLACCVLLYQNIFDIFALLGTSLHVAALWFTREKTIRRISLCGSPCWLVYNLASRAYFSAVSDSFAICSIILAMLRYDRVKKPQETDTE